MSEQEGSLSRRNFLTMVGAAGGAAAVHETLVALGLMRHPSAWATSPPHCQPDLGKGQRVVVLGAGIGGLATAYWLSRCGYECKILEAQGRVGGRSYTARHGDEVVEEGRRPQRCNFDNDPRLYVNLGPGRIPYHHRRLIKLCRDLEVPLEVYVHTTDANFHWMQRNPDRSNRAIERRRIVNDTQGYVAELLAKAICQRALDKELSAEDQERLLSLLQKFGSLDNRFKYTASPRSFCPGIRPDVKEGCDSEALSKLEPLQLTDLLDSEFWDPCIVGAPRGDASCDPAGYGHGIYQVKESLWQTTSFQPVGGMDQIVKKLAERIGDDNIKRNSAVTRIALAEGGDKVEVTYTNGASSDSMIADFCVSNIPLTVLKDISAPNFSRSFRDAVRRGVFSNSCKVGWQANRRFWEKDHHIYGGISWIQHEITQMWYPSNDYFSEKGTLTGAYNYGRTARDFGNLSLQQRLDKAYEGGRLLHPRAFGSNPDVPKNLGISIAWQNVPFQKGCYAVWYGNVDQDELDYETLLAPDLEERFYIVGDQVSTLPGWQEGALMSARHVFDQITTGRDRNLDAIRKEVTRAPTSLDVMG